jgi:hypothetical protein
LLNVLERPGAAGIALTGHHELLIPMLHAAVSARLAERKTNRAVAGQSVTIAGNGPHS